MAALLVSSISYAETPRFNSTGSMTHGSGDNAVTLFDSADFYTLQSSSDALQSNVDALSTNVSSVSSELRNDIQEVNLAVYGDPGDPSIPSYESRIAEMEESLNNSADGFMAQVDRLDSRVTGLENRMSGLENAARTTSYTITYDYAGGTAVNTPSYTASTPTFTLNAPTRTGYTFSGWLGSGIDPNTPQMTVTVSEESMGDLSYTATWDPITYYVKYDANGGSGGPSETITVKYGEDITISSISPAKYNYIFLGWAKSSSATSATYTAWNNYKNLSTIDGSTITLYAVYKAKNATLTFAGSTVNNHVTKVEVIRNGIVVQSANEASSSVVLNALPGDKIRFTHDSGKDWRYSTNTSSYGTHLGTGPSCYFIVPNNAAGAATFYIRYFAGMGDNVDVLFYYGAEITGWVTSSSCYPILGE